MDTVKIAGLSTEKVKRQTAAWRDSLGIVASFACAIHCAAMPFIVSDLPSTDLSWLTSEGFHQGMAIVCILIGMAAFLPGWQRHRNIKPMLLGCGY